MAPPAGLVIRPVLTDDDLHTWNRVRRIILPDEPIATIDQMRARESPQRLLVLAEVDGELAGHGLADVSSYADGSVTPRILPAWRRRGIGGAVLDRLIDRASELGHRSVASLVDEEPALAFATARGFSEIDRQVEQVRQARPEEPEPAPYPGVTFMSVAEMPSLRRDAWAVAERGYADMKLVTGPARVTFDEWLNEDATLPGGSIIALADGRVVGWAGLIAWNDEDHRAENGLTAVDREWRGRGLAAAMKRRQLRWAAEHGIHEIVTWTQQGNEAMQHVNIGLGYVTRSVAHAVRRDTL